MLHSIGPYPIHILNAQLLPPPEPPLYENWEFWVALATLLLTAATIALAVPAWKSLGEARTAHQNELRAYVGGILTYVWSFNRLRPAVIEFKYHNVGKTPAMRVRHRGNIEVFPHPLPQNFALPEITTPESNPFVLFPDTENTAITVGLQPFTARELAAIRTERMRVYYIGQLSYEDVFGRSWTTNFCQAVVADSDARKMMTRVRSNDAFKLRFEFAPLGNNAT